MAKDKSKVPDITVPPANLKLWNSVEKTDPEYTNEFNKKGFKGTAISPVYMIKKATEAFGPAGIGWGYEIIEEKYVSGAPTFDKNGNQAGNTMVHVVRLELWYKNGEDKIKCPHQFGQTEFCGQRKSGDFYTDEEAPKKSVTDALGKCLVMLGFSADIHLGRFDDNKYVDEMKKEFKKADSPFETNADRVEWTNSYVDAFAKSETKDALTRHYTNASTTISQMTDCGDKDDADAIKLLQKAYGEKLETFKKSPPTLDDKGEDHATTES